MTGPALGRCPVCASAVYLTKAGALRKHLPGGQQNDGGVVPPKPRCEGSGMAPSERLR